MFTEILNIRVVKAKQAIENTKAYTDSEKPIIANDRAFNPYPTASGTRLLYFETSHPEIGNPINEPIGMASKMVPSSASFNPKIVLTVGIRDAQVAKLNPEIKKNRLR